MAQHSAAAYTQESSFFTWTRTSTPAASAQLCLYVGYVREVPQSVYRYDALVRGWLFQPQATRKSRIMTLALEKLVGSPGQYSSIEDAVAESAAESAPSRDETSDHSILVELHSQTRQSFTSNLNNSPPRSPDEPDSSHLGWESLGKPLLKKTAGALLDPWKPRASRRTLLRERLEPLSHKSLNTKDVQVIVESAPDADGVREQRTFWSYTDDSGRFTERCRVPFKPDRVRVIAGDAVASQGFVHMPLHGVSVISDVDDTVRHSGVTKSKRELLQNILAKHYDDCRVDGVAEWYREMRDAGAAFHYVSNSPWQLYHVVEGFLRHHGFPAGTIHLKKYASVFDSITEPVLGRKRATLDAILRDFPERKFILVGDSGEADLEAYAELAAKYPRQVVAVYIRDITLPPESFGVVRELENDLNDLGMRVPPLPPRAESALVEACIRTEAVERLYHAHTPAEQSEFMAPHARPPPPPPPRRGGCARKPVPQSASSSSELSETYAPKAVFSLGSQASLQDSRTTAKSEADANQSPTSSTSSLVDIQMLPVNSGDTCREIADASLNSLGSSRLTPLTSGSAQPSVYASARSSIHDLEADVSKVSPPATERADSKRTAGPCRSMLPPKPALPAKFAKRRPVPASDLEAEKAASENSGNVEERTKLPVNDGFDHKLDDEKLIGPAHEIVVEETTEEKPALPPRQHLLKRTSSRLKEGAYSMASASSQAVSRMWSPGSAPSPTLSSSSEERTLPSPPTLPRRTRTEDSLMRRARRIASDLDIPIVPSTQDIVDAEKVDKRAENWKFRLQREQQQLPRGIQLKTWRSPADVESLSVRLIRDLNRPE